MKKSFSVQAGEIISYQSRLYRIHKVIDLDNVIAKDEETGESLKIEIDSLKPVVENDSIPVERIDLAGVKEEDWEIAERRMEFIRPFIESEKRTAELAELCAKEANVHRATIYRWVDTYERSGLLSSLLPLDRSYKRGGRLDKSVEIIIKDVIENYYLKMRKPSPSKTYLEIKRLCWNGGLTPPHENTIRNRIKAIDNKTRVKHRLGKKIANQSFNPILSEYPDAYNILSVYQIDHTPANIILVDDETRLPIGRPWLTVAIDVYSRMVAGVYISLNPPSADSVGLCLANAILPKEDWLAKFDIKTNWPVWGIPDAVHADNAKEFRGKMLRRAAKEYSIDIYLRPVARPEFGAHIERLLGTFKRDIESLPGTTFANVKDKGDYPSEKEAALTLFDFEKWLAIYITEIYHQRVHSGVLLSPIKKYNDGVFGTDKVLGRGIPDKIIDEERLYIDFLPFYERTVQNYGIQIDEVFYYSHVLNRWINSFDEKSPKLKKKFIVRRNPRDISVIYFYDPELNEYFEIPYRDTSRPAISLWELRKVKSKLKEEGLKNVDENKIFEAYDKIREIENKSIKKTKSIRRADQRRKADNNSKKPSSNNKVAYLPTSLNTDNITPFDDMEDL